MKKFDIAIKIFFLIIIIFPYSMIQAQLNPLINEILASNINYMADNYGDYDDIIELYNPTDGNINLAGYYLSDDYDNLKKWVFPQNDSLFILAPNEYLVMWADDEIFQGINHLPFSLNKNGEAVILTHPNGNEIIHQINFGYQRSNISFGINDQSGEWEYYINPTIGYENEDGFDGILNPPSINPSGGYSSNPTIISLTDNNLNSDVYYNFDSQIPVEDNYLYDQEIIINNIHNRDFGKK